MEKVDEPTETIGLLENKVRFVFNTFKFNVMSTKGHCFRDGFELYDVVF